MSNKQLINSADAYLIGLLVGVDWEQIDLEQFRRGLEIEHSLHNQETDGANDDPLLTGRNTLARLNDVRDYYMLLAQSDANGESGVNNLPIKMIHENNEIQNLPLLRRQS
jgi:hypothetical protein